MNLRWSLAFVCSAAAGLAQTTGGTAFEVASVRPAESINTKSVLEGKLRLGTQVEGLRVSIDFVSLADLVRQAYGIKPYQLNAPDWMASERYDIRAKMPQGSTKEQVPEMLKTLLAERFKVTLHHDSKEHQVYALVVGKSGSKLKEVEPDAPAAAADSGKTEFKMSATKAVGVGSSIHVDRKMTMPAFCDYLSRFTDRPVVDMTGLTSTYQIVMDLPMDEVLRTAKANGAVMIVNGVAGPVGGPAGDTASDPSGSAVFATVQQLGLKLDQRKAPIDLIVIDHAEKVPVEN